METRWVSEKIMPFFTHWAYLVFHVAAHSALLIHFSYFGNEEKEKISGTLAGAGGVGGVEGSPEVVG